MSIALKTDLTRRLTVDEYHDLIETGVLTENDRVELLEGWLVEKMPHNPPHDGTIVLDQEAIVPLLPDDWHVRIQSAITTSDSEPEPDIAVVRGKARRYVRRHPGPKDIGMLVEVADSTLQYDRTTKCRIYARCRIPICCRIPIYWIVNLVDGTAEVYTRPRGGKNPRYLDQRVYSREESVPLIIAGQQVGTVAVTDLLPW